MFICCIHTYVILFFLLLRRVHVVLGLSLVTIDISRVSGIAQQGDVFFPYAYFRLLYLSRNI